MLVGELLNGIEMPENFGRVIISYLSDTDISLHKTLFYKNFTRFCAETDARADAAIHYLAVYCALAADVYATYREKDISRQVYFQTFSDITIWAKRHYALSGKVGLTEHVWLQNHLKLKLFRLGRLQFMPSPLGFSVDVNGIKIPEDEIALTVHIAEGTSLLPEEIDSSFSRAKNFFRIGYCAYTCESWLINRKLKELLPPDSNIIKFQNRFIQLSEDLSSRQAEERVFGRLHDAPSDYPQDSSLQRVLSGYLAGGNRLGTAFGIMTL